MFTTDSSLKESGPSGVYQGFAVNIVFYTTVSMKHIEFVGSRVSFEVKLWVQACLWKVWKGSTAISILASLFVTSSRPHRLAKDSRAILTDHRM